MNVFVTVWFIVVLYCCFFLYLYHCKIIPTLHIEPSSWNRTVLEDIQTYVLFCDKKGMHPWFLPFLRYYNICARVLISLVVLAIIYDSIFGQ